MNTGRRAVNTLFISIMIMAALAVRAFYVIPPMTVQGDSAVFALMAKHILELKEFPIYMWLAHYGGTLPCYIGAGLFKLFGISSTVYLAIGLLISMAWACVSFILARKILDRAGAIYALIAVLVPPSCVVLYSSETGSINSLALLFGSLSLLLLVVCRDKGYRNAARSFALLGIISGAGLWLTPAMAPFILATLTLLIVEDKTVFLRLEFRLFILGFLAGYFPAIVYNLQYPNAALFRLAGRVLELDRGVLMASNLKEIVIERILWRLSTVPVSLARIPDMLISATGPVNTVLFFIALVWARKDVILRPVLVYVLWFSVCYAFFVGLSPNRYIIPVYAAFPFLFGKLLSDIRARSKIISTTLLLAVLLGNVCGNAFDFIHRRTPHYAGLVKWMLSRNYLYGYAGYWTSYPVIFESGERILVSPTLLHPTFSDRMPEYTAKVRNATGAVYIIGENDGPGLALRLEGRLKKMNIKYKKDVFEEFSVYSEISRKVYPEEIALK